MPGEIVRVMTFNLWHGGDAGGKPVENSARVIQAGRADIVGFQEAIGFTPPRGTALDNGAALAERMGWHYLSQGDGTGIASRFPILAHTSAKSGAKVALPSGRHLWVFNTHLMHTPYQPYQLLQIPYNAAPFIQTGAEAVWHAIAARGEQVERLLADVETTSADNLPTFLTGDFNEPSHRDWTEAAVSAGHCPVRVEWPSTLSIERAGFADAYRSLYPDPVARQGRTWTPTTRVSDPADRHDRIDFVFVRGAGVSVQDARIIGESYDFADIVVEDYPSDHRAVVCACEIG